MQNTRRIWILLLISILTILQPCFVYAYAKDNKVEAEKEKDDIIITKKALEIVEGDTFTYKAEASDTGQSIVWSVSNKKLASINEKSGKLKAKKAGTVTVTVKAGKQSKSLKVKIYKATSAKNFKYSIKNNEVTIESFSNVDLKTVVVPAVIEGKPVRRIGRHAFSSYSVEGDLLLKTLIIPGSITNVEAYSIYACFKLETLTFLEGAKGIQKYCVDGDTPIKNLSIPGSQKTVHNIGRHDNLVNVSLGEGITKIDKGAFNGSKKLISINLPETLTTIENNAFTSCSSLKTVKLPKSIKNIERSAFNKSGIEELELLGTGIVIGTGAFADCNNLKRVVLGDGVTVIKPGAFANCSSLTDLTIADSVNDIATGFAYGAPLKNLDMNYVESRNMDEDKVFRGTPYYCMAAGAVANNNYGILSPGLMEQVPILQEFYNTISDNDSDVTKVKKAHDWVIRTVEYDHEAYTGSKKYINTGRPFEGDLEYAFDYRGLFINKMLVCEGYTDMMNVLLSSLGIESIDIVSITMGHAWNMVKLNDKWYHIDATWDDMEGNNVRYKYFLISDQQISIDHPLDYAFNANYPICSENYTGY